MALSKNHVLNDLVYDDISKIILDEYVVHDHETINRKNKINYTINNKIQNSVIHFDVKYKSNVGAGRLYRFYIKTNILHTGNKLIYGRKIFKEDKTKISKLRKFITMIRKCYIQDYKLCEKEVMTEIKINEIIDGTCHHVLIGQSKCKILYSYYFRKRTGMFYLELKRVEILPCGMILLNNI